MKRRLLIGLLSFLWIPSGAQIVPEGSPHIFTVLVEFRNVRFSTEAPERHFTDLLNGQVSPYFAENSRGRFSPVFDVYGPVLLDTPMSEFGGDVLVSGERIRDKAPEKALYQACLLLDDAVDFSRYDADGDGIMDLVLFCYAGYDQAAGGPSDAIWSHHQDIRNSEHEQIREARLDGVMLGYYFCTAELRGSEGTLPIGIGSTVHEMGHALGLPDFYDTNGGESGTAGGLYQFSPMCRGLYNDGGDTPPYMTAIERLLLGWMDEGELIELREGWMSLDPIQEGVAAISRTETEGEFFLYEYRSGTRWDAPLSPGLLVYHVDRSGREVDGIPAMDLWAQWRSTNRLNASGKHPCCYVVPPMAPQDFNYAPSANPATLVFPGVGLVHAYAPKDWENAPIGIQLTLIEHDSGAARFLVLEREGSLVSGRVEDADNAPVSQVTVRLIQGEQVIASDITGMDGVFLISVPESVSGSVTLVAEKNGYRTIRESVTIREGEPICRYWQLFAHQDPASARLFKYDPALSPGYFPREVSLTGAVRFTAEELAPYVGGRLERVVCFPYITHQEDAGPLYVVVDIGGERVCNHLVEDPELGAYLPVSVDMTHADIRIPEGLDVYVGYGFQEQGRNTPLATVYPGHEGNSYYAPFSLMTQSWQPLYLEKAGFYMDLMLDTFLEEVPSDSLAGMGFNSILLGNGPYVAGKPIDYQLIIAEMNPVDSVLWTLDGNPVSGGSITPTAGEHVLEAHLRYRDGREELLQVDFRAN